MRKFAATAASIVALLQPLQAQESPYFRFRGTEQKASTTLPPGIGPNDVRGDGDLALYSPVSVRGRIAVDFTLQFVAADPIGGVTWSLVQGTLPDGLSLSTSGLLSGRPTSVQDAPGIVLGAIDSSGRKGTTKPFLIEVRPVPTVSMPTPTTAMAGKAMSVVPSVANVYGSQTWRMTGGLPVGVMLDAGSGTVSGKPEQKGHFGDLAVGVTDSDGAKGDSNAFAIDVDARMTISGLSATYVARQSRVMSPIRPMVTGNEGPVTWDLSASSAPLPSGLSVDTANGSISGVPAASGNNAGIVLRATDSADGSQLGSPTLGIKVAGPPAITLDTAYVGRFGSDVSFAPVATNLLGDGAWTLSGGLPAGLTLNGSTGRISGRMGSLGASSGLVLTLTDLFDGETARSAAFSVTGWPALVVETPAAPETKVGVRFGMPAPSVTGLRGTAVHTLSGTIPPGLSVDTATGAITGVPSLAGTYPNLVRTVRDTADDAVASARPIPVVVKGPQATIPFAVSPMSARYGATVSKPFLLTPSTTGETSTVTWSLVGTLPAWATFSTATGSIGGTPTEAVASDPLVLTAQDGPNGPTASSTSFYVNVVPRDALTAKMPPLLVGAVDTAFSGTQPTVTNAQGGLSYAMASGQIPDGLTFNAISGTFVGAATTAGDHAGLAIRVRDGSGAEAVTGPFTIRIEEGDRAASMPSATGEIHRVLTASPFSKGLDAPVAWSVSEGTLPPWATLDTASGTISGTPDTVGTTNGLVLLAKGTGPKLVRTNVFSLSAVKSPSLSASMADVAGAIGRSVRAMPSAFGARGAQDWRMSSGTLPAGLTLDTGTGTISGVPTAVGVTDGLVLSVADETGTRVETNAFKVTVLRSPLVVSGQTGRVRNHAGSAGGTPAPSVSGNLGAVTWSIDGPVPPGMAAAADGHLAGTPTTIGPYEGLAFVAHDTDGANGVSQPFAVDVLGPIEVRVGNLFARLNTDFAATPATSNVVGSMTWSKVGSSFPDWLQVDPATGTLHATPPVTGTFGGLALRVQDSGGSSAVSEPFTLTVFPTLTASIDPSLYQGRVGVPFATSAATTKGESGAVTWSAVDGSIPAWGTLAPASGVLSGTPTVAATTRYSLQAKDAYGYVAKSAPVTVVITPAPTIAVGPDQGARAGAPVTVTPSISGVVGTANVAVTAGTLPTWAKLDALTGVITGTAPAIGTTDGLRLTVTDSDRASGTSGAFSIRIRNGIVVSGLSNPRVLRAAAVSTPEQARVDGAAGTISWAAKGLPSGMSISPSGLVSGTPAQATTTTVTVMATDASDGAKDSLDASYTVIPVLQVTGPTDTVRFHPGTAVSKAPSITGQRGTVSWRAIPGTVPDWLKVDPDTGIASGTASSQALYKGLVIEAKDDFDNATARTLPFDVEVLPAPGVTNMATNYTGRFGFAFRSTAPTLQDGIGAVNWKWGDGVSPPAWVSLDPATGAMTGTPDALGNSNLLFVVGTDATGATARSVPFRINVFQQPVLTLKDTSVTVRVGTPVNVAPNLSGLAGTPTWEVLTDSGAVPAGLTQDPSTGALKGTPTAAGSGRFRIRVTDAADKSVAESPSFNVVVLPSLSLTLAKTTVNGHAGTYLTSGTPRVDGSVGALSFKVMPDGVLAPGLTLDSNGVISGVPQPLEGNAYGAYVTVTVTDAADNATSSAAMTINVMARFRVFFEVSTIRGRVGSDMALSSPRPTAGNAYSAADVRWTLASGTLPTTVTVDARTGRLVGTPSVAGTYPGLSILGTDVDGASAQTGSFDLQVGVGMAIDTTGAPATLDELLAYDFTVRGSGVTGTPAWSVTGLPNGMGIAGTSGRISGTPALRTNELSPYAASVTLTDTWDNASVTTSLPLTVASVPSFRVTSPIRLPDQALPDMGRCLTVPVTNAGSAVATGISQVFRSGGDSMATCPVSSGACGTSIEVGATCAIGLRMVAASPGDKTGVVRFQASRGQPLDVDVSGTALDDLVADPFSFPSLVDQVPGARVVSTPVTITGLTAPVKGSVTGDGSPLLRVDGGPWLASPNVSNGQKVEVQVTAPATGMTTQPSHVSIGTVTSDFVVQTGDAVPDAFAFASVTGATGGNAISSAAVTLRGMTVQAPASLVAGGSYPVRLGVNGSAPSSTLPATIPANATLVLSLDAAPGSDGGTRTATLTVGGVSASWSVTTLDTTPSPFAFTDVSNAPAGQVSTSTPVLITDITSPTPASVSGEGNPQISVVGGAWGTTASVTPGQSIQVRLTASDQESGTPRSATVTIGGVSAGWTVTTVDTVPDGFQFAALTNQALSTLVTSAPVTITGISSKSSVTISGVGTPQVRIAGTGNWANSGFISAGQTLEVQLTTAGTDATGRMATVTVGGVVSTFTATTGRMTPDAFAFPPVTNAPVGAAVTSQSVQLTGMTLSGPLTVAAGGSYPARLGINSAVPSTPAPATVPANAALQLSLDAPATADGSSRTATVTVNGVAATWTVTSIDTVPDAFGFGTLQGQTVNTVVESAPVTISGISVSTPVTVSGTGTPEVSINGAAWTSAATAVSNGQAIAVRLTTDPNPLVTRNATVTIGGVAGTFAVRTQGTDTTPDAFAIAAQSGLTPGAFAVSPTVTPVGYDAPVTLSATSPSGSPMVSIAGKGFVNSGTLLPGQSFIVRTTVGAFGEQRVVTVAAGGVSTTWSVTARVQDSAPDTFAFATLASQNGNTVVQSAEIQPTGYADTASVTVSGPGNPQVSIDGGAWVTSGTITPGKSIKVQMTTDVADGLTRTATVSIGGVSANFSTITVDSMPDNPWTQDELDNYLGNIAIDCCQCLPGKALKGFTSPVRMNDITCTPTVGATPAAGYYSRGSFRNAGDFVSTPGDDATLCVHTSGLNVSNSGSCTYDLGGRKFTAKYKTIATKPDPTRIPQMPFFAGKTPGTYVYTQPAQVFYNLSPSLISVSSPGELEINGNGTWYPGGSQQRLPVNATFRVRAPVPASGKTRISVYHGEQGQLWNYFEVTPNPAVVAFNTTIQGTLNPMGGNIIGGHWGKNDRVLVDNTGNVCVPFDITYPFNAHIQSNGNAQILLGFLTSREAGFLVVGEWKSTGYVCPGENYVFAIYPPSVAGQSLSGNLTFANVSIPLSYTLAGDGIDGTPDAYVIPNLTGQAGNTLLTSASVTLSGYTTQTQATVSGQGNPQISLDGGSTWGTSLTASPGAVLRVRLTTGAGDGSSYAATVTVGGVQSTWTVATADLTPDAFAFTAASALDPSVFTGSNVVAISGLGTPSVVSVAGSGSPQFSINSGGLVSSGTIKNGDTLQVFATSSATYGAAQPITVTVGSSQVTWSLTTRAQDTVPGAFPIPARNGQAPDSVSTSAQVTPNAYLDPAAISVSGQGTPEISVNGGAWSTSGTISPGSYFQVRLRSDTAASTARTATVSIGGVTSNFVVTTSAANLAIGNPTDRSLSQGTAANLSPPVVTGYTGAVTYALFLGTTDVSGSLGTYCTGLAFGTADGKITGTPTAPCSRTLGYGARDTSATPQVKSGTFLLTVPTGP